jgi:DNA invertase Pin-like site-specific DNA recombinase
MARKATQATDNAAAVLYIRVSTDEQAAEGVSLAAQEARLRAYCTMRGLAVAAVVRDEGVSAFKPLATRPGGRELLAAIADGSAAHVVAVKLDRLFRNAADALAHTEAWAHDGVSLHLVDMGGAALDTASATGRMMLTMLAGFAEFERALTAERTTAALAYKRANREAYAPTPYGYTRTGDTLAADAAELATVARIRALSEAGHSLAAIARTLTAEGVPTKRGGRWHASTVRYLLTNEALYTPAALAAAI